jgi:deoxyribose-phosphate aldolase
MNISFPELMHLVDLTCLKDKVIKDDIESLVQQGQAHQVAALCVWPSSLDWIGPNWQGRKATVVNFPHGRESTKAIQLEMDKILLHHPGSEIDYVFPYHNYWSGEKHLALNQCHAIGQHCAEYGVTFKVILETGIVKDPSLITSLAQQVIEQGADMLKTSTGKTPIGATKAAVEAICLAIKKTPYTCGLKVSGGIKTFSQAKEYLDLITKLIDKKPEASWLRFGCSQLLNE